MDSKKIKVKKVNSEVKSFFKFIYVERFVWLALSIFAIINGFETWQRYFKYLDAYVDINTIRFEADTPEYRIYAIDLVVNNSSPNSISVVSAIPFMFNKDKKEPEKILIQYGKKIGRAHV